MRKEQSLISLELSTDNFSRAEEKAFELLQAERERSAIDMNEFEKVEGYGKEKIERDKERMARKKREIKERDPEPSRKARLLEMMLTDQIELSNWFGQNAYTIIPAEYDDLFHGVDLALEIEEESGVKHLALGIDATSSFRNIRDKLRKIKEHIADGTLTAMEYFHSDDYDPDFYGTMNNIPQVVIGTDGKTIRELVELWMSAYGLAKWRKKTNQPPLSPGAEESQKKSAREAKEELAGHRVQFLLLEEIKIQLIAFKKFAEQKSQTQVAEKMASTLKLINSILRKKRAPNNEDVLENNKDLIFRALSEAANDFENL